MTQSLAAAVTTLPRGVSAGVGRVGEEAILAALLASTEALLGGNAS